MRVIAIEEHFTTSELLSKGGGRGGRAAEQLLDTAEGRLASMDEAGIDLQVLSTSPPGAQDLEPPEAIEVAQRTNDELARIVAAHPDRFAGFATLPTRDPKASALELERCMVDLGFKGAMIHGHTEGHWLDEPQFAPIFEAAEGLDAPIYLHPRPPTEEMMRVYFSGLPQEVGASLATGAWGWHAETGLHVLRMIAGGVFERFPQLQMIVGHMGENVPFSLERADSRLTPILGHSRGVAEVFRENFVVTTSAYFTVPPLLCALLVVGADRIVFSVDYPYADNLAGARFLESAPISPADREKIAHANAERLLKLAPG